MKNNIKLIPRRIKPKLKTPGIPSTPNKRNIPEKIFQYLYHQILRAPDNVHLAHSRGGSVAIYKENVEVYYIEIILNLDPPFEYSYQQIQLDNMVLFIHNQGLKELGYFQDSTISYNYFTTLFKEEPKNQAEQILFNSIKETFAQNKIKIYSKYLVTSIITQPFE